MTTPRWAIRVRLSVLLGALLAVPTAALIQLLLVEVIYPIRDADGPTDVTT